MKNKSSIKKIILGIPGAEKLNKIRKQYNKNKELLISEEKIEKARDEGYILEHLDELVKKRRQIDKNYINAFKYAFKLYRKEKNDNPLKKEVFEKILSGLNIDEISESFIMNLSKVKVPLQKKSSFKVCQTTRTRKKQLGDFSPEWKLNHKIKSYLFIDSLGIKRPWISEEHYKYSQISELKNIVIKPLNEGGSRGIYIIYNPEKILDIRNKIYLSGKNELIESMKNDLATGLVKKNRWFLQELLISDEDKTGLPRDLKFYCFYGKVALIKEVCRLPEAKRCWWTADGEVTETGKYKKTPFLGNGVTPDQIKLLEYISSEIPAPFLRIDFLKTNNGLVFGEFTPRPGQFENFNKKTDQWLGDLFLEAEGRLLNDLLNGKTFDSYKNYLKRL